MDNSSERNLTTIYTRLFKLFLINEINKINEFDCNSTKSTSNNTNGFINEVRNSNNLSAFDDIIPNREFEVNDLLSNDENSEPFCPFWDYSKISINNNQQFSNCYQQNPFKSQSKSSIQDDIYTLDFQGRYFIEK